MNESNSGAIISKIALKNQRRNPYPIYWDDDGCKHKFIRASNMGYKYYIGEKSNFQTILYFCRGL